VAGAYLPVAVTALTLLGLGLIGVSTLVAGIRDARSFEFIRGTAAYYSPEDRRKLDVPPGITGWPQVAGRTEAPWKQRIRMDIDYVDHYSPWRDLWIAARTVRLMLEPAASRRKP
jgi:hypothetical protein